jgi:hypothetical protein
MKPLKILLAQSLIVASLLLPWSPAGAVDNFRQFGVIQSLSYDKLTIGSKEYRVAPGATLDSDDVNRKRLSDFKKGDKIYFEGKLLDGVNYIDKIVYRIPVPS